MEEKDVLTTETRAELLVLYGYLKGLNGKVLGQGNFGGLERMYVPEEVISPLKRLLFPKAAEKKGPVIPTVPAPDAVDE